jgi:DNA (cytosine-5)-methyltransferase 1
MNVSAIDLFCGAGGLTHGLESAGITVTTGIDSDAKSRHPYEENNDAEFRRADVRALAQNPERVARLFPWDSDVRVLAACAPCQPYSTLSHSKAGNKEDHEKWGLLDTVRKIVEYVEPEVVVTENVLQVRNDEVYRDFETKLQELGYSINSDENKNVYCPEYGIPQKRKRWVLLASKEGELRLPDPVYTDESEYPTVRESIGHLPPVPAGEHHPEYDTHRARSLSETNLERIRNMEPGGDWRLWEERGLDHLLADCHTRESGRSYKAPYSRMRPDEPAPTITTQFYNYGSGRFGHYDTDQDRALTLLEGALLQTFPQEYDFYDEWDDVGVKNLGRLIGNAVPPLLGAHVGEAIRRHVGDAPENSRGASEGASTPLAGDDD